MPYEVRGKCIYHKDTNKKVGCTKGSVQKYLAALHANANESSDFQELMENEKPSIFTHTIYRVPTNEELEEVNNFDLTADELMQGFGYTMIGRGILDDEIKGQIVKSIGMLCSMYPDNQEYKKALDMAKAMKGGHVKESSSNASKGNNTPETTKELIKRLIREKLGL